MLEPTRFDKFEDPKYSTLFFYVNPYLLGVSLISILPGFVLCFKFVFGVLDLFLKRPLLLAASLLYRPG